MNSALHFWGIFCCLCFYAISKNIDARPDTVSIGALFTFNSTIGRVAKIAMAAAVSDINNDSSVLPGTNLVVQMRDSNCSGFVGIVQGTSS
jgi:ionotropic glutamate receptor/U3 small nucleolar RNA-associated protein 19